MSKPTIAESVVKLLGPPPTLTEAKKRINYHATKAKRFSSTHQPKRKRK